MNYTTVYEGEGQRVRFDSEDSYWPYCIEEGEEGIWLSRTAIDALTTHNRGTQKSTATSDVVKASDIPFNEALMRLAAVHGRTVTFRYAKGGGEVIETRNLKPEKVQQVGDHVTFTGYDPDRDEPRAYRIDRIKGEVTVQ